MRKPKHDLKDNRSVEAIGWLGVILILTSYILISAEVVFANSYLYHVMMLTGSLALAFQTWHKRDLQPAILNIVFALVAMAAISRISFLG